MAKKTRQHHTVEKPEFKQDTSLDIFLATSFGSVEAVSDLIDKDKDLVSHRGLGKSLPLENAIFAGHANVCQLWLDAGSDPNVPVAKGSTYLHLCARQSNGVAIAQQLIAAGAFLNVQDDMGMTALHRAAEEGFITLAQVLINAGANCTLRDQDGKQALDRVSPANRALLDILRVHTEHGVLSNQTTRQSAPAKLRRI